ncbi:9147_t:CDS:2 [Acaulospora colombiana]|uniref:9147_t:CDS:1 n=1 Tax=Acaulospora colombiana TaxID=27376 RepID=A0ACA9MU08_9GLOM|nr:9147_t:CDS:2 [Acaulospora colombiana]
MGLALRQTQRSFYSQLDGNAKADYELDFIHDRVREILAADARPNGVADHAHHSASQVRMTRIKVEEILMIVQESDPTYAQAALSVLIINGWALVGPVMIMSREE